MLSPVIAQLEQLIAQIQASGVVAHEDARLDISTHSKSGYEYARLRNGSELSACGRVGSEKYLEVLATLQRRDKISELMQAISSLKQAEAIPVIIPAVGKLAALATPALAMPAKAMATPANVTETASSAKPKAKTKSKSKPAASPKKKKVK